MFFSFQMDFQEASKTCDIEERSQKYGLLQNQPSLKTLQKLSHLLETQTSEIILPTDRCRILEKQTIDILFEMCCAFGVLVPPLEEMIWTKIVCVAITFPTSCRNILAFLHHKYSTTLVSHKIRPGLIFNL